MSMKVLTFKQNINVVQELKKAQEYSLILKDCPINSLMSSTDLRSVLESSRAVFDHFKKLK